MLYMVTFTINTPQMLAYIPYMDPMGYEKHVGDEKHILTPGIGSTQPRQSIFTMDFMLTEPQSPATNSSA